MRGVAAGALLAAALSLPGCAPGSPASAPRPESLVIGETLTLYSSVLGEERRINVYVPPFAPRDSALPVLYMLDGGVREDFVHMAGLVQVLSGNGGMRPFMLVGIENTARRRDLTGPTRVASDSAIAPVVGGSAAFRSFVRDELMPHIETRYRTTDERAIIGESLAGLFVVETLLLEPGLFRSYIAVDPSLWWNGGSLVDAPVEEAGLDGRSLYVATSSNADIAAAVLRLGAPSDGATGVAWHLEPMPSEAHATIFHPAALRALRHLFGPVP